MRTTKQKILLATKIFSVLLFAAIIAVFVFRESILKKAIVQITHKIDRDFDSNFTIQKASFQGFSGVVLSGVLLVPKKADTLFRIENITTQVNFWKLFLGDIQLSKLEVKNGFVNTVKNENGWNFKAFLPKKDTIDTGEKPNYAKLVYKILNRTLNLVPTDMQISNLTFKLNDMGSKASMHIQKMELVDKQLESAIEVKTNTFSQRWKIKGFADPRNKQTDIRFFNLNTGKIKVPYLDERYNIKSSFDSIRLNVDTIDMDGDELHINGYTSIANFTINHPKIASKDVVVKNARFDYRLLFGEHFVAIDSASTLQLNQTKCNPYLSYNNETDKIYSLKVKIKKMKAQDFINSLPDGLFTHFKGMEVTGDFDYNLNFVFNKNKPNRVVFDSNLHKENLKILKYGEANLSKLNGEFEYRAIINNIPQRPIFVGQSNPNYAPIAQISPYLKKCVLTTEDPTFYSHRGFITEAFKMSIVKNLKTKKFTRGGSTISMQLIKNTFLKREKTVSRKLEEILLVYIMENNHIVSKERILEVYFNIIEWGPNIYGIGEASHFYFQKTPAELTLNECLFLANIIPSPKKFMYQFNDQGNLKSGALSRERYLKKSMMRRGLIVSEDTLFQIPIMVIGNARSFIKIKEVIPQAIDSTAIDEFEF